MADTTTGIITNPEDTNQTVQDENMQDLGINLDANEQKENKDQKEIISDPQTMPELDLDLDLNLPEAPKNDDRLKQEDENNKEIETNINPVIETIEPIIEDSTASSDSSSEDTIPVIEEGIIPSIDMSEEREIIPVIEETNPINEDIIPVIEEDIIPSIDMSEEREIIPVIEEDIIPSIDMSEEREDIPVIEETNPINEEIIPVIEEDIIPSIDMSEEREIMPDADKFESMIGITTPSEEEGKENIPEPTTTIETERSTPTTDNNLEKDMDMISELEGNSNAGGLAPEASISTQPAAPQTQEAKTFNLDDMLSMPIQTPVATPPEVIIQTATPTIETPQIELNPTVVTVAAPIQTPAEIIAPAPIQATTTPTIVAAIPTPVPAAVPSKNTGVKVLLFVVLFGALAFTTFFILKTMYPIEFSNMFGGNNNQGIVQDMTETELTGDALTEEIIDGEMLSGDSDIGDTGTGSHESAADENPFGELNDLGNTETTQDIPEKTDISKLTDYVNEGNTFLTQGKNMGNNTVIKYGLYVSKKATSLLEKIANGEQIDNITGYFAQFDQYLSQLKGLIGESSSLSASNDLENSTETDSIKQFTGE